MESPEASGLVLRRLPTAVGVLGACVFLLSITDWGTDDGPRVLAAKQAARMPPRGVVERESPSGNEVKRDYSILGNAGYYEYGDAISGWGNLVETGNWGYLYPPITMRLRRCLGAEYLTDFVPGDFGEYSASEVREPPDADVRSSIGTFGAWCTELVKHGVVSTHYYYTCNGGEPSPMTQPLTRLKASLLCGFAQVNSITPRAPFQWDVRGK